MNHVKNTALLVRILLLGATLTAFVLLVGCTEVNVAIDSVLGRKPPVLSAASDGSQLSVILAKKQPAGAVPPGPAPETSQLPPAPQEDRAPEDQKARPAEKPAPPLAQPPAAPLPPAAVKKPEAPATPAGPEPIAHLAKGKKRAPGEMAPRKKEELPGLPAPVEAPSPLFEIARDPFKAPTEVLPSECPPSMPLCKFDRSQLKLVGVIRVEDGYFKGMVEDPDGRGYFVTPGMQIGGATVTQVREDGITLHLSKTGQDVVIPLFLVPKQSQEF